MLKIVMENLKEMNKISFTLYPAHSRVGRGLHFPLNSGGNACRMAELNAERH